METVEARTDEELAVEAQRGCTAACDELLHRVRPLLVRFLELRTGQTDLAEDLTQETLLRAVQKLHQYDSRRKLRSWLLTIARRIGDRRSFRPWITYERSGEVCRRSQVRPEDPLIADESTHQFWCRLARQLPLDDLVSLWLVHTEGLSHKHVGRLIGWPANMVKMRMHRVRQKLRQQLAPATLAEYAHRSLRSTKTSRPECR